MLESIQFDGDIMHKHAFDARQFAEQLKNMSEEDKQKLFQQQQDKSDREMADLHRANIAKKLAQDAAKAEAELKAQQQAQAESVDAAAKHEAEVAKKLGK